MEKTKYNVEFYTAMKNAWIAEPLSQKGRDAMTNLHCDRQAFSQKKYLQQVYVDPFTIFDKDFEDNFDTEEDPEEESSYIFDQERNSLEIDKARFEKSLRELQEPLYVIQGGPGCGKTTYARHLEMEEGFEDYYFKYLDFENIQPVIQLFDEVYEFDRFYENNIWKFVSLVTAEISYLLTNFDYRPYVSNHKAFIKEISDIYQRYFFHMETGIHSDPDQQISIFDTAMMRSFFNNLRQYANTEEDQEDFKITMYTCMSECFHSFSGNHQKEATSYVCGILIRLYFCLNQINKAKGQNTKYVCVIDNIESFVRRDPDHPIQDCELESIMSGVYDSAESFKTIMNRWKNAQDYQTFFGFLLVTRTSSLSLTGIEKEHYVDYDKIPMVDIKNWFYMADVFESKKKYFDMLSSLKGNPYYQAYTAIIGDVSQYYWCTYNMLNSMYNNNYRRIGLDLVEALAIEPETAVREFLSNWNSIDPSTSDGSAKHLCRKYIFRILLGYIHKTGYFDDLMVENMGHAYKKNSTEISRKTSYARKIATILHRNSLLCNTSKQDKSLTLVELIEAVLVAPNREDQPVNDAQLEDLGHILYLMNETRYLKTHWAPLIHIRFDMAASFTQNSLTEALKNQWKSFIQNGWEMDKQMQKFRVEITQAGSFFARMIPEFEYFACRYAPKYPALIIRENLREVKFEKGANSSYRCLELIKKVRTSAFNCIDEIMLRDRLFFSFDNNEEEESDYSQLYKENGTYKWFYASRKGTGTPHPVRILDAHIGYLNLYRKYLESLPEEKFYEPKDKEKILEGVSEEIERYFKRKDYICRVMPGYFMGNG